MIDPRALEQAELEEAHAELLLCAIETTGFRAEAISADALHRVLRHTLQAGATPARIIADARRREQLLVSLVHQAISVGETFFFRQPEQFDFISAHVQLHGRSEERGLRGWSAGCATGEEAYSLAACLLGARVPGESAAPFVLGTDLVERNVVVATMGLYRPWSVRASAPLRHAVFRPGEGPLHRVSDTVRAVTQFQTRNLLDPSPPALAPFDVILCRNVLVYFTPAAAAEVCRNLAEALAPGGLLLFGTMDLLEAPAFLERVGPPELQIFRPRAAPARPRPVPTRREIRPPAPIVPVAPPVTPPSEPDPSLTHLTALDLIERGEDTRADETLRTLQASAPDYVPGILERALLCARLGRPDVSRELMRLVLRLAAGLPLDELVDGPQVLPVRFYVASAEAFLERVG